MLSRSALHRDVAIRCEVDRRESSVKVALWHVSPSVHLRYNNRQVPVNRWGKMPDTPVEYAGECPSSGNESIETSINDGGLISGNRDSGPNRVHHKKLHSGRTVNT